MSEQAIACCENFDGLDPQDVLDQIGSPAKTRGSKELWALVDDTIPIAHFDNGKVTCVTRKKGASRHAKLPQLSNHAKQRMGERQISGPDVDDALSLPRGKHGRHVSPKGVVVCVSTARGKGQTIATVYSQSPT